MNFHEHVAMISNSLNKFGKNIFCESIMCHHVSLTQHFADIRLYVHIL